MQRAPHHRRELGASGPEATAFSGGMVMWTRHVPLIALGAMLCVTGAVAQSAKDYRGPPGVIPLAGEQPPAKIVIDPPDADWLNRGMVVIQYRAEILRIVQVFGPKALDVSPRIGHV